MWTSHTRKTTSTQCQRIYLSSTHTRIKNALQNLMPQGVSVYLVWVRAHIGIEGNEEADKAANGDSWKGDILRLPTLATPNGMIRVSKQTRRQWRHEATFGSSHSNYGKQALTAYTWMRTNKGPQRDWLHRIGKAESPACQCGHHKQDGHHITFTCPRAERRRLQLIGHRKT